MTIDTGIGMGRLVKNCYHWFKGKGIFSREVPEREKMYVRQYSERLLKLENWRNFKYGFGSVIYQK